MRRSLSSVTTVIPMLVMPVVFLFLIVGMVRATLPLTQVLLPWVVILAFFSLTVYFSWRLCFASTDGIHLFLWSYRGSDTVDLSRVAKINAISRSRTPRVEVFLDSPSRLGTKVIIIPPVGFSMDRYWNVYKFLAESARESRHDLKGGTTPKTAGNNQRLLILAVWLLVVLSAVGLIYFASHPK